MFDKFFDCLNVRNMSSGRKEKNLFKSPYRKAGDFRVEWLKDVFLKYLDDWEKAVQERPGFSAEEKNTMLISHETRLGLRITVHSFIEFLQYIFKIPGVTLFLSNRLSQDPIEKFFGQQRQRGSSNDNPIASQFQKNTQTIRVVNTTCSNIRGNCRGTNKASTLLGQQMWIAGKENKPLPKRRSIRNKKL
ncbi:uncharacterized protein [Dysidea avara]|uniref:uncharacterized protein n=1 Tax=Dysidea avara TaxID=196820 RepID=UPI00332A00B6